MNGASAEVLTKFTGNTKDLDNKTNSAKSTLSSFASGVGKAFKASAVAIGTVSAAIGVLVKQSVDAYAEFEQLEGGLEALFGKGSNEMNSILAKSETAWEDLTMSQNDYLTAFESSYSLVKNGLADETKAIDYTNKVLQLSSDLFNTYGKSTEYYQGAIEWALKGTFSYLDNLQIGIKGTSEGFVEAANASGILGRSISDVKELTNEEIVDVIQHYAEAAGAWGRTQEEASTTITGSLNMVKSTWNNLVAGFAKDGADMDKLIDNFINSAMKFGENLLPVIERALTSIATYLPSLLSKIGEILPGLLKNILPGLITGVIDLINALIPQIGPILTAILPSLLEGVVSLLNELTKALPSLIPVLMDGLVQGVKQLSAALPDIIQALIIGTVLIIQALAEELPTLMPVIVDAILQIIPILIENLPLFLGVGGQLIMGILQGLINSIPKLLGRIPQFVNSIIKAFKDYFGIRSPSTVFANIGQYIVQGLWNGITGLKDWVISKVKGFGKSILNSIKNVLGIHSPSTEFAMIGKFSVLGYTEELDKMTKTVQGQIAETFSVSPQLANSSSLHYSPNVVVNTVNNISQDPLGRMVNDIKTFSGGAKNDYNYGTGVS